MGTDGGEENEPVSWKFSRFYGFLLLAVVEFQTKRTNSTN